MSGGAFEYEQYRIRDIAIIIAEAIRGNKKKDEYGYANNYSKETLDKFKKTIKALTKAEAMTQRVDWLLSGDDGEDDFHERWEEEGLNK